MENDIPVQNNWTAYWDFPYSELEDLEYFQITKDLLSSLNCKFMGYIKKAGVS